MVLTIMFLSLPPTSSMSNTTACGRRRRLKGDVETLRATQVPSKAPVGHLEAAGGGLAGQGGVGGHAQLHLVDAGQAGGVLGLHLGRLFCSSLWMLMVRW